MFNLSSAEGARFAEVCEEMTESVRALGPSPLGRPNGHPDGTAAGTATGPEAEPAEGRP